MDSVYKKSSLAIRNITLKLKLLLKNRLNTYAVLCEVNNKQADIFASSNTKLFKKKSSNLQARAKN